MDFHELCCLIVRVTGNTDCTIQKSSHFSKDLGLCSWDMMTLIAMIESRTHKQIDMIDLSAKMTVEALLEQINT